MTDDDDRKLRPGAFVDDAGWLNIHDSDEKAEAYRFQQAG
jgi:hypothetical protein